MTNNNVIRLPYNRAELESLMRAEAFTERFITCATSVLLARIASEILTLNANDPGKVIQVFYVHG